MGLQGKANGSAISVHSVPFSDHFDGDAVGIIEVRL